MKKNDTAAKSLPIRKSKVKKNDRQKKYLCLSGGALLWSAAGHCTAYGILGQAAQGGEVKILTGIAAGCMYLAGAGLMLAAAFAVRPVRPWKRCRKRLCYFAAGYLGVQLLLSIAAGAFAWCLGYFAGLSGESVKTGAGLLCSILQVPVHAAAMILVLQILAGFRESYRTVFLQAMAAYALYTLCQYLLTLWQGEIPVQAVRVLLSAVMTCILWTYIYSIYKKEDTGDGVKKERIPKRKREDTKDETGMEI